MSDSVRFRLVDPERLLVHEEVVPEKVEELVAEIRRRGFVEEPIWVAEGHDVILNGHHRFAALRRLGARRVPVWLLDYEGDGVRLERWDTGPPVSKAEVLARARAGRPFPPKTTRHSLEAPPPPRHVPLARLMGPEDPAGPGRGPSRALAGRG
jgi:hypothetical protein